MMVQDFLSEDRIFVDLAGSVLDKPGALRLLGGLLQASVGEPATVVEERLVRRERISSTGIGDGVAIPHASVEAARRQAAALLLCPRGIEFDSIDGRPVRIIVGVVSPKAETGEHLKLLARVSRLLRPSETRNQLVDCRSSKEALDLILERDATAAEVTGR